MEKLLCIARKVVLSLYMFGLGLMFGVNAPNKMYLAYSLVLTTFIFGYDLFKHSLYTKKVD